MIIVYHLSKYLSFKKSCELGVSENGIERFMVEFASYKKKSTYDHEKNECTVSLWYDPKDKTELLIMLLGFGPVLEIPGPDDFRELAAERIEKQYRLFYSEDQ